MAYWCAAQLQVSREQLALYMLQRVEGFIVYAPRLRQPVITALRRREHKGAIELPKPPGLEIGDQVKILRGPFQGHLGLHAGMKPRERVEVLLMLLGGQIRTTLPKGDIMLAPGLASE